MGKRGRPRKIKKLEEYTLSELRDMPMGSMLRLFMSDLVGKKAVVASPVVKQKPLKSDEVKTTPREVSPLKDGTKAEKTEQTAPNPFVAEMIGMPLDKKADYLADALMGYLKKSK